MYCKKCGAELPSDAAFCEECGTSLEAAAATSVPVQIPAAYSQPVIPQKKRGSKAGIIILTVVILAVAAVAVIWLSGGGISGGGVGGGVGGGDSEKPGADSTETDDSPGVNGESMQLSTTDIPAAEDFAWFTDKADRWVYGITPADAYMLEDFYAILGSWKGLQMVYDYDGTILGCVYFTATFEESGPNIAATLEQHYVEWANGSREELTGRENENMTGSFAAPTLAMGEDGNRIELILYAMDGKQYAEGIWTVYSGEEIRVALVRP